MNDQYEGQGGSYVIDANEGRKLVERTREPGEAPPAEQAEPETEAAPAAFFTPVTPAEQSPTTE